MLTRDQEYAIKAHERVLKVKGKEGYKSYGAMAHQLPILIHTAGLAQALTFVDSRDQKMQKQLLSDLAETVDHTNKEQLLRRARGAELREYMLLTRQVLAALVWYKRFAQSILDVDASQDGKEEGSAGR